MPKRSEAEMSTIAARKRLARRPKPYWRHVTATLQVGVHVGAAALTWRARRYLGGGRREETALGLAESTNRPADGATVLSFDGAVEAARRWQAAREAPRGAARPVPTVAEAVREYLNGRRARLAPGGADATARLAKHLPGDDPLAALPLAALDAAALHEWRRRHLAAVSPATTNRLLNDLRAALNEAGRCFRAHLPPAFGDAVRDGLRGLAGAGGAREAQVIPDADVRRVAAAADALDPDFGALVMTLAATGARFDQAARITVADLQPEAGRVMVPPSRKGRGGRAKPRIAVPLPPDVLARLRALAAGRAGHEPLLVRWHHEQAPGDRAAGRPPAWRRAGRRPWGDNANMARPWRTALAAAGLPATLVPYCLRHSSVVRGLRAGLPVRLVAAVHDTSVAMIERHYAAHIADASDDLLRRAVVPLAPAEVAPLRSDREATDS